MNTKKLLRNWFYFQTYRIPASDVEEAVGSEEELENYLKALFVCAAADGEITETEKNWIFGSALARGCSEKCIEKLKNYTPDNIEELFEKVVNTESGESDSKALIYNAIRACASDGEISEEEKEKILELAEQLNVSEEVAEEIFAVCEEEEAVKQRVKALIAY